MSGRVIRAMVVLRLKRVLNDRSGLIWMLVMPMVFSFLMGQLMGDWSPGGGSLRPRFLVADADGGPAIDRLLADLRDQERFLTVQADTVLDPAAARLAVDQERLTAVLVVPAGFSAAVAAGDTASLHLFYDSERLSSQSVRTLLERALLRLNTEAAARSLVVPDSAAATLPRDRARGFDAAEFARRWESPRVALHARTLGRVETGPGLGGLTRAAQHAGPAYTLFFLMMFLMTSAKDLVTERRDRTLARLRASRASAGDLAAGFFLSGLVLGLVQAGILLLLNQLAFGLDYGQSPSALALCVTLFAGVSSAGAVLLGAVARSEAQADGLGVAATLFLAAVGGLWWPLEIVPDFMQALGRALPTGQAISVFHDLIGRGWGLARTAPLLAGLAAWFAVLLALAAWRLRRVTGT